jgi:hypothetical protein
VLFQKMAIADVARGLMMGEQNHDVEFMKVRT